MVVNKLHLIVLQGYHRRSRRVFKILIAIALTLIFQLTRAGICPSKLIVRDFTCVSIAALAREAKR